MNFTSSLIKASDETSAEEINKYLIIYFRAHDLYFLDDLFYLNIKTLLQYIGSKNESNLHLVAKRGSGDEKTLSSILGFIVNNYISFLDAKCLVNVFKLGLRFFNDKKLVDLQNKALELIHENRGVTTDLMHELKLVSNFYFVKKKCQNKNRNKNNLNIAICVSGQLRNFSYCKDTWSNLGFENHEIDFYIHTWTKNGRRIPDTVENIDRVFDSKISEIYKEKLIKFGYEELKKKYPSLINYILKDSYLDLDKVCNVYKPMGLIVEDDSSVGFKSFTNQQKMLYGIYKCYEMVKDYGKNYDLVIRIRPDRPVDIKQTINWNSLKEASESYLIAFNIAHTYWINAGGVATGDQFIVAAPEVYNIYARTYRDQILHGKFKQGAVAPRNQGFLALAKQLYENGIRLKRSGVSMAPLSDPPPIKLEKVLELIKEDTTPNELDDHFYKMITKTP